ncbi:NAD(P)-binding protein [Flavivirga aquimarina]|uniref:NAD(P)-binding protein n=1 Tax=Flavivirga aquimarina TaxID=2027862 RepID=A0ABT8W8P1_9FLAO|nr:NAD(P)-binding protein [Flavivirga aquimarina]MDO5969494.1 NAD(P)-binding protein [Flavivirga aquimarina]
MKKIAIIGSGISGMTLAHNFKGKFEVELFEKESRPGGLIKCDVIDGNLYHLVGGHVFNSKRQDVLDWFWNFFDKDKEFTKSNRNAVVYIDKPIGYPIENHLYQMNNGTTKKVINDLLDLNKSNEEPQNFEQFLKGKFGLTLYEAYFKPYNEKIWKKDLSKVPLTWLEGKLPMPKIEEILYNNIKKEKEMNMVHSSFFYPKVNGSQFLADRLSEGLNINLSTPVEALLKDKETNKWIVNSDKEFDMIFFAGNIKSLASMLKNDFLENYEENIKSLDFHGTTTVLCEVDPNDYSWIYMPNVKYDAHRIICTGNFSKNNNKEGIMSATVEFTDYVSEDTIKEQLKDIPFTPKYISHKYTKYTYPIQDVTTRSLISEIKGITEKEGLYLSGRFAEWEYYNMDAAIGAAIDLSKKIFDI